MIDATLSATAATTPASPIGVLEILNRNAQVVQRLVWDGAPLRIGRALDNHLVVADPYVCPHHLELSLQQNGPQLRDSGSINGSYLNNGKERLHTLTLGDNMVVHFGHSQLRFHTSGSVLAPTLRDSARLGALAKLSNPWVFLGLALLALLALFASQWLEEAGKLEWLNIAEELSYPVIGVFAWAGFWALINRVLAHRSHFTVHLGIAFAGVAGLFALSQATSLLGFALDLDGSVWWMKWLGRILVLSLVVYAHLHYFSQAAPRNQAMLAGFAGLLLFGTPAVGSLIERTQFSSLPWLEPLLRPPAYQLRDGMTVEEFLQRAQSLRERADREARLDSGSPAGID
jgi:hypothetical protein